MKAHMRIRRSHDNQAHRASERRCFGTLKKDGYEIKQLSDYQFRVNGVLDIYPTNNRWCDIKTNERGDYESVIKFVRSRVPMKSLDSTTSHKKGEK